MAKHIIIPIAVFFVTLICAAYCVQLNQTLIAKDQRLLLNEINETQANAIEHKISRAMASAELLAAKIVSNKGAITNAEFKAYSQQLIDSLGTISNLQLAKDGIVSAIHPITGNESAIGHNLFADDRRNVEANLAKDSGILTLSGPFPLIQGDTAVIGRKPIFLNNPDTNSQDFWGFSSVMVYLDKLLAFSDLNNLTEKGYQFQLSRISPDTQEVDIFYGEKNLRLKNPSKRFIEVPNGQWLLCISNPNYNSFSTLWGFYLLGFVISSMLAFASFIVLKQPLKLEKIVKQKTAELEKLAYYDPLTSLCNRRLFNDMAGHAIELAKRNRTSVALLYLDLDQFKSINDTLGHEMGDKLLIEVANRLRNALRKSDVVARLGGDEFCVLLSEFSDLRGAAVVAEKILTLLRQPVDLEGREVVITPSIGITLAPDDAKDKNELLKHADMAMYAAKSAGRNNYVFYNDRMDKEVHNRMSIEMELQTALNTHQFEVYYQPILSLDNKNLLSAEALLRWNHPNRGIIEPGDFIPIAEEIRTIIPLGYWVFRQVCEHIKHLQNAGISNLPISINLSPVQFEDHNLLDELTRIIAETGVPTSRLHIEITESILMKNVPVAMAKLKSIQDLGISVAIDDFGTGYSSFSYMKDFPIDTIKVDKSFIDDLDQHNGRQIVAAILGLCQQLDLNVIAEGIETHNQERVLKKLGCAHGQGFLYSEPMTLASLFDYIQKQYVSEKPMALNH